MILRPQDLVVALKLAILARPSGTTTFRFGELAADLALSTSETHAAVRRAMQAQILVRTPPRSPKPSGRSPIELIVQRENLLELVLHGVKYVWVPDRGGSTRGMPTAHAAPPLVDRIVDSAPPPVWPDPNGTARGEKFAPLYPSVPAAARKDPTLYAALALVDALRGGRARERNLATTMLPLLLEGKLHA